MFVLNIIIALSLVVISVVKTTELFIASDKKLNSIRTEFIKKTQDLHLNNKGSISLTSAVLTSILALLFCFYLTKMQLEFKEAKYRKESYLCFHYLNVKTENYISEMSKFNVAIRAAYVAKTTLAQNAATLTVLKTLVLLRNTRHIIYLKNLGTNKYCQAIETKNYLTHLPYKTKSLFQLETNTDETTILRENKWTLIYYKNPRGIRLTNSFCLQSDFFVAGIFSPQTTIKTKELEMKDLSNLKCLSGSSS